MYVASLFNCSSVGPFISPSFCIFILMDESNTVVSAYTLYRHLQRYYSHPSTWPLSLSLSLYLIILITSHIIVWVPQSLFSGSAVFPMINDHRCNTIYFSLSTDHSCVGKQPVACKEHLEKQVLGCYDVTEILFENGMNNETTNQPGG